jgi:hypothetical protein
MKRTTIILLLVILSSTTAMAQETAWRDTLKAAVKTDARRIEASLGRLHTGLEGMRGVVSPLGEGDPTRWAQGLPGVATGADGTTSMYVRGGGSGNNLLSLDGVPVYGYSHILGLTTIIPNGTIESASLGKGGFDGAESNFTAAHLRVVTRTPGDTQKFTLSLNNFLAGAEAEGPIGNRLSYIVSARVSPLTWEYLAVRNALPDLLKGFDHFSASIGDVYGKVELQTGVRSTIDFSALGSLDRYDFGSPGISHEMMGWQNLLGQLRFRRNGDVTKIEVRTSANMYENTQEQYKTYRNIMNRLTLRSLLDEYTLAGSLRHQFTSRFTLGEGLDTRYAVFAPGQSGGKMETTEVVLAGVWLQADYSIPDIMSLRAALRGHYYNNLKAESGRFDPEASLAVKVNLAKWLSLEVTGDRLMQYYHTLEGLPVGWSLDMIVPSGAIVAPETAIQGNAGLTASAGGHSFSAGGFYKQMDNLVYYKYAQSLFSGALASWEDHVDIGKGTAYGTEFLYEYIGNDFYARAAYTLSKATRHDFAETNGGRPFHARFDRRHVLNAMASWRGLSATFILQSGHWENGAAETYPMHIPGGIWEADYFAGVNNYHMPTVIRLDLGYQKEFKTGKLAHTVNLGVCNVTNHFNPFMLYFDPATESWKEIALMPIMPNFSWRVEF